jgi:hypothetical protein
VNWRAFAGNAVGERPRLSPQQVFIGRSQGVWTVLIALPALRCVARYRVETWQLVLGGAAIGVIHYLLV